MPPTGSSRRDPTPGPSKLATSAQLEVCSVNGIASKAAKIGKNRMRARMLRG
jgi:hypothetical protein